MPGVRCSASSDSFSWRAISPHPIPESTIAVIVVGREARGVGPGDQPHGAPHSICLGKAGDGIGVGGDPGIGQVADDAVEELGGRGAISLGVLGFGVVGLGLRLLGGIGQDGVMVGSEGRRSQRGGPHDKDQQEQRGNDR